MLNDVLDHRFILPRCANKGLKLCACSNGFPNNWNNVLLFCINIVLYFSSPGWNLQLSCRALFTGFPYTAMVNNHILPFRDKNFKAGLWFLFFTANWLRISYIYTIVYYQLLNPKIKNSFQILGSVWWAREPWRLLNFKCSTCPSYLSPTQWTCDDRNEAWVL